MTQKRRPLPPKVLDFWGGASAGADEAVREYVVGSLDTLEDRVEARARNLSAPRWSGTRWQAHAEEDAIQSEARRIVAALSAIHGREETSKATLDPIGAFLQLRSIALSTSREARTSGRRWRRELAALLLATTRMLAGALLWPKPRLRDTVSARAGG